MTNKVSQTVLEQALARMSDASGGFNSTWVQASVLHGVSNDYVVNIDFTSSSNNFCLGQINPDMLEQSGLLTYPFLVMYVLETSFTGTQKFNQFSGSVDLVMELFLSWTHIKGIPNYEKYANCAEATFIDVFNRVENQNWTNPVVYNGGIRCRRGPLTFAGENWRQRVGCALRFEVHE